MVDTIVNDGGQAPSLRLAQMETIGKRIKELRDAKNLSQQKLADAVGVVKQTISSWENDEAKNPKLQHLFSIADALGVEARWLALGHNDRLCAPIQGFPVSDTGKFRIRRNAQRSQGPSTKAHGGS